MIAPDIEVGLTVLERTNGVVPVIDVLHSLSMTHTATREAHELGLEIGDDLCEVLTKTVLTAHEGFLWEEADDVDTCLLVLQSCNGETSLLTSLGGLQHSLVFLPVCPLGLDLGLGNDATFLRDQGDDEVFLQLALALWGRDIAHEHREVVLGTCCDSDAVPSFVIDGVVAQYGIMGIVLAQWIDGDDNHRFRTTPGGGGTPATMVLRDIFEVAILDEFGVESSISGITDILEEDTNELVADGFLLTRHFQRGRDRSGDVDRIVFLVVVHTLLTDLSVFCLTLEMAGDGLQFGWGDVEKTTILLFAVDGNGVACPGALTNLAGFIFTELPEVGRGRYPALIATLGLIVDVESAVIVGEDNWTQALAGGHDGIILRTPADQILAIGNGEQRTFVIHLEDKSPGAIGSTSH